MLFKTIKQKKNICVTAIYLKIILSPCQLIKKREKVGVIGKKVSRDDLLRKIRLNGKKTEYFLNMHKIFKQRNNNMNHAI